MRKGLLSPTYLILALLTGTIQATIGGLLAYPEINWLTFVLCVVGVFVCQWGIVHSTHDLSMRAWEKGYSTLSEWGLMCVLFISGAIVTVIACLLMVWVGWEVSIFVLGGLPVLLYGSKEKFRPRAATPLAMVLALLGSYYVQAQTIDLKAITMALSTFAFYLGGIALYKIDEFCLIRKDTYEYVVKNLTLMLLYQIALAFFLVVV